MKIEGNQQFSGTPDQVFALLLDPSVLKSIMPGCESLEVINEDQYVGVIRWKVGFFTSEYNTNFRVSNKKPPQSYTLHIEAEGTGGEVNGHIHFHLAPNSTGTELTFQGEMEVGGKVALLGDFLIDSATQHMISQGLEDLTAEINARI